MSDETAFTATELVTISLVLGQNADEYDIDDQREIPVASSNDRSTPSTDFDGEISRIATKARELASEQTPDRPDTE